MMRLTVGVLLLVATSLHAVLGAQSSPRADLAVSLGADRFFRAEDRSFGTVPSLGIAAEWRVTPRTGVGVDVHRASGLDPDHVRCSPPAGITCTGIGRDGVFDATVVSVTAAWHIAPTARIQPYIVGGMSAVHARTVSSLTIARPDGWTVSEQEDRDTGVGITAGAGLRVPVSERVVIKPEWRLSSGSLLGRANLAVMRSSVSVGYGW